jgi:hypothetical protein
VGLEVGRKLLPGSHNFVGAVNDFIVVVPSRQNFRHIRGRITGHLGNSFLITPSAFAVDDVHFVLVGHLGFFGCV